MEAEYKSQIRQLIFDQLVDLHRMLGLQIQLDIFVFFHKRFIKVCKVELIQSVNRRDPQLPKYHDIFDLSCLLSEGDKLLGGGQEISSFRGERHGLDHLGLSRTEPIRFRGQTLYMHIESSRPDHDPFETLKRVCMETHKDSFEVLVFHPGYLDDPILKSSSLTIPRTREAAVCCADETKQWLRENGVRLYRFDEL